jgi:hypothetical protein
MSAAALAAQIRAGTRRAADVVEERLADIAASYPDPDSVIKAYRQNADAGWHWGRESVSVAVAATGLALDGDTLAAGNYSSGTLHLFRRRNPGWAIEGAASRAWEGAGFDPADWTRRLIA